MKAYIRYGANGTIISGVLVKSNKKPTGVGWVEVPMTYCCSTLPTGGNSKNKAFIKYAGNLVIPGSTIIRKKKPKSGTWVEVPYQQCCTLPTENTITVVYNLDPSLVGENIEIVHQLVQDGPILIFSEPIASGVKVIPSTFTSGYYAVSVVNDSTQNIYFNYEIAGGNTPGLVSVPVAIGTNESMSEVFASSKTITVYISIIPAPTP